MLTTFGCCAALILSASALHDVTLIFAESNLEPSFHDKCLLLTDVIYNSSHIYGAKIWHFKPSIHVILSPHELLQWLFLLVSLKQQEMYQSHGCFLITALTALGEERWFEAEGIKCFFMGFLHMVLGFSFFLSGMGKNSADVLLCQYLVETQPISHNHTVAAML